ncbi:MAG: sulfopyruvate decarboxylase subunit beta [Phycisphaerae bacterium]|nr:sulfopyruvate decarboxylase subunit beta [Phycisphaerae bacterium]
MRRYDVIQSTVRLLGPSDPIICNIGDPCMELHDVRDRAANFYMLGSLGLASSIGLGVALGREKTKGKIVVIDGDGGVLMNLGSLATIGRYCPENLIVVIVDNQSYGSTGNQSTATTSGIDLSAIARDSGITHSTGVNSIKAFEEAFQEALTATEPAVILARTNIEKPKVARVEIPGPVLRDRFMEAIR